jgi:hypothetical protein
VSPACGIAAIVLGETGRKECKRLHLSTSLGTAGMWIGILYLAFIILGRILITIVLGIALRM